MDYSGRNILYFSAADNNGFLHKEDAKWLIILNTAPLFITTLCAWLENGNKPWSVGTHLILYSVPNNLCCCACIVLAISTCVMVLSQDAQAHMRIASFIVHHFLQRWHKRAETGSLWHPPFHPLQYCKEWSWSSILHSFKSSGETSGVHLSSVECDTSRAFSTPFWIFNFYFSVLNWKIDEFDC